MKYKIVPPPLNQDKKKPPSFHVELTRYLYVKEEVMISMTISILEKKREEALFWAYELYWSGFQTETFEYLSSMFWEMFESLNPRLGSFIKSQIEYWKQDKTKHYTLGTIIRNLTDQSRKFQVDSFVLKKQPTLDNKIKDHKFYIMLDDNDVKQYENLLIGEDELPRFILGKACRYSTRKECNFIFGTSHQNVCHSDMIYISTMKWEYYASFSPIWSERIEKYNGTVDHDKKTVVFEDDDDLDEFYDQYGYEPDEQRTELLSKITHVNPVAQMSLREFAILFNAKQETLDRINNSSSECHQNASP
jgi:hypothetical protein